MCSSKQQFDLGILSEHCFHILVDPNSISITHQRVQEESLAIKFNKIVAGKGTQFDSQSTKSGSLTT
jgi:hypothetical protein